MSIVFSLVFVLLVVSPVAVTAQPNDACCNITPAGVLLTCKYCALDHSWDQYTLNAMNITAIDVDAFNFPGSDKDVHMMGNLFTKLPDGVFRNLTNAVYMDLSWGALVELGDHAFQGLTSLKHLDLSINSIASLSPLTFRATPALQTLSLQNQFFNTYKPGDGWVLRNGTFATNANLTDLTLFSTALLGVETGAFQGLRSLQNFDFSNGWPPNTLSPPFPDLSGSQALRSLDLGGALCGSGAPGITLPVGFLRGLGNLTYLVLAGNGCIHTLPRGLFTDQSHTLMPMISGINDGGQSCGGGLPTSCKACGVEVSKLDPSCFS